MGTEADYEGQVPRAEPNPPDLATFFDMNSSRMGLYVTHAQMRSCIMMRCSPVQIKLEGLRRTFVTE